MPLALPSTALKFDVLRPVMVTFGVCMGAPADAELMVEGATDGAEFDPEDGATLMVKGTFIATVEVGPEPVVGVVGEVTCGIVNDAEPAVDGVELETGTVFAAALPIEGTTVETGVVVGTVTDGPELGVVFDAKVTVGATVGVGTEPDVGADVPVSCAASWPAVTAADGTLPALEDELDGGDPDAAAASAVASAGTVTESPVPELGVVVVDGVTDGVAVVFTVGVVPVGTVDTTGRLASAVVAAVVEDVLLSAAVVEGVTAGTEATTDGAIGAVTTGVVGAVTDGAVGAVTDGAVGATTLGAVGAVTFGAVGAMT